MLRNFKVFLAWVATIGGSFPDSPLSLNHFINYARRIHPFTNTPFQWGQEHKLKLEELNHRLVNVPVLAYPDFSTEGGHLILDTDASQHLGIGAILSQLQADGTERVITYDSRSLKEHEKNVCTTGLEILAPVPFVDHFRYYLLGQRFILRTGHHSLKWLMLFKEPQRQMARWLDGLQEFDYEVDHRPGRQHCNADAETESLGLSILFPIEPFPCG